MIDRVPMNPGRVLITPENGGAAYYATMTRADNPTQEGTPLNKAALLKDTTAALMGLDPTATPDDMLKALSNRIIMISNDYAGVTVNLKTQSGNPMKNMLVPNVLSGDGEPVYTDENGQATGFVKAGIVSIPFVGYADIEDHTETFEAKVSESYTKEITLSARNFLQVTSTKKLKFSGNVQRVDVNCVGGGGGGGGGEDYQYPQGAFGGGGGGGGHSKILENAPFEKDTEYTATIGSGGSKGICGSDGGYEKAGDGGNTSFLTLTAEGGKGGENKGPAGGTGNGNGGDGYEGGSNGSGYRGGNGAEIGYKSFTETTNYGGGGGGGAYRNGTRAYGGSPGTPFGGEGGGTDTSSWGSDAIGFGGGGGGGMGSSTDDRDYNGGKGYKGCVNIRMHLIATA